MHHRAKLTNEQVRKIRQMYASGTVGYRILAKVMGCSQWTIRDIVKYWTRAGA